MDTQHATSTTGHPRAASDWRYFEAPALGFALDLTFMDLPSSMLNQGREVLGAAWQKMRALEGGALANPDESRQVGHYWLRDPALAPTPEIRDALVAARQQVERFAAEVHGQGRLRNFLLIGIGGSALGPQLVAAALGNAREARSAAVGDQLQPFFLDNTDPDGIDRVLARIAATPAGLAGTLVLVISKSGGTKETRNGMLEAEAAFTRAGLRFADHAVAVTGEGSELQRTAKEGGWRAIFPMWDFVGGRTSVLSPVGLLPAALQGVDIGALLQGAAEMDALTRLEDPPQNPAALLALSWFYAAGIGRRDMVVLPYKDRLELFSRYLQQLVMESLGKEKDLDGKVVHQGIAVYGNKGSTDQHAYVQQLRDGLNNFFAVFIQVLRDRQDGAPFFVEPQVTSGDYLQGFLLGTRQALHQSGRYSLTLTIPEVSARTLGQLIALFERAVGLYASMVNINAYHQPGVEAGKRAAAEVLALQLALLGALSKDLLDVTALLKRAGAKDESWDTAYQVLEHLAANGRVLRERPAGARRQATCYARLS